MKQTLTYLLAIFISTSAFAQFPDSKVDRWNEGINGTRSYTNSNTYTIEPELDEFQVEEVLYNAETEEVTSATVRDENGIVVCTITKFNRKSNYVYQDCGDDYIVSAYHDGHGLYADTFEFDVYQRGEKEPFAHATIKQDACKECPNSKKHTSVKKTKTSNVLLSNNFQSNVPYGK